jgi:2-polyprenyl-6-methoxyphenol hydroxylase-like FAD-dependent oxidoreductase
MQGLGGVGAAVREQIGPAAEIDYRPLESILVPPPWHRGRVVLIGDAVHATTPHLASGAGLAVEDALVLCQELESAASVEQALAAHTERRYPRCRAVVETSLAIAATQLTKAPPTAMFQLMQQGFATLLQPY